MKKKYLVLAMSCGIATGILFTGNVSKGILGREAVNLSASRTAYSLEEGVQQADAVAQVRIEGIETTIGEDVFPQTIHKATVLSTEKGQLPKSIRILQDGTKKSEIYNNPIFKAGEEYLLTMKKADSTISLSNVYWITNEYFLDGNTALAMTPAGEERAAQISVARTSRNVDEITSKINRLGYQPEVFDKESLLAEIRAEVNGK